jgi:uncharacterized membrane protein
MTSHAGPNGTLRLNPVYLVLLIAPFPLFLGALFADIAYSSSYQVQWTNFASWLIAGGLVFCGGSFLWTLVEILRTDRAGQRPVLALILLLATWLTAFINVLTHAKDAWASMPSGLFLSIIVTALMLASLWAALRPSRTGAAV